MPRLATPIGIGAIAFTFDLLKERDAIVCYDVSFQTYRKVSSLAVATLRPLFRVARFNADRTLSLLSVNWPTAPSARHPFEPDRDRRGSSSQSVCAFHSDLGEHLLRHVFEIHRMFLL